MPTSNPRRLGQMIYLKPECIEAYKICHAEAWPEVLEQIQKSNISDCMFAGNHPIHS